MTAYGVLAIMATGDVIRALPFVTYLLSQQNSNGGFQSTQDTVVGLQALVAFAESISDQENSMRVIVEKADGAQMSFDINSKNSLILQQAELPASTLSIDIGAFGCGFALLHLTYKYNILSNFATPRFTIHPKVSMDSDKDLRVTLCSSFIPMNGDKESNMAVMEIEFPTGYTSAQQNEESLKAIELVRKVETSNGGSVVIIYLDKLGVNDACVTVVATETYLVSGHKPASIKVYDYYDTTRRALGFYDLNNTK